MHQQGLVKVRNHARREDFPPRYNDSVAIAAACEMYEGEHGVIALTMAQARDVPHADIGCSPSSETTEV